MKNGEMRSHRGWAAKRTRPIPTSSAYCQSSLSVSWERAERGERGKEGSKGRQWLSPFGDSARREGTNSKPKETERPPPFLAMQNGQCGCGWDPAEGFLRKNQGNRGGMGGCHWGKELTAACFGR
jgi:hypothetical protein